MEELVVITQQILFILRYLTGNYSPTDCSNISLCCSSNLYHIYTYLHSFDMYLKT
jgi:hypothetical protein